MSTTLTFGNYVTAKAPTKAEQAEKAYHGLCNALLDMHWAAVEVATATRKADRLSVRMDRMNDRFPIGTPERGEAEAVHWSLMQAAKRETATVKRRARHIRDAWDALGNAWQRVVLTEILPGWGDSAMWRIVLTDPVLGRDPVWTQLIRSAESVDQTEVPF